MENFSNKAPRVEGFDKVTFWREGNVGIIALLYPGLLDLSAIDELTKALSTAAFDDKVESIILTGTNNNFSEGIKPPDRLSYADFRDFYDHIRNIILIALSLEKPIFSFVGGRLKNNGLSLALLTDKVISTEETKIIWDNREPNLFLSTITFPMKLYYEKSKIFVDSIMVSEDKALEETLEITKSLAPFINPSSRRYLFNNFEKVILEEEIKFLDFYLWCENNNKK